ncbi:MAG TPA: hypothetical protein VEC35_01095 [Noviherbaspirillum sp.]|nr:hypothetical protein [Noviherbaspirillum sp.]
MVERGFAIFHTKEKDTTKTTHRIDDNGEFSKEDAEFIVRACNAHDDLVKALREYVERHEAECDPSGLPEYDQARSALAKAGAA